MIIAQYYQFLRLGFDGYKKIMSNLLMVSRRLRLGIEETGLLPNPACSQRPWTSTAMYYMVRWP